MIFKLAICQSSIFKLLTSQNILSPHPRQDVFGNVPLTSSICKSSQTWRQRTQHQSLQYIMYPQFWWPTTEVKVTFIGTLVKLGLASVHTLFQSWHQSLWYVSSNLFWHKGDIYVTFNSGVKDGVAAGATKNHFTGMGIPVLSLKKYDFWAISWRNMIFGPFSEKIWWTEVSKLVWHLETGPLVQKLEI